MKTVKLGDILASRGEAGKSPSAVNLNKKPALTVKITGSERQFLIIEGKISGISREELDTIGDKYNFEMEQKRNLLENRKLLMKYINEGLIKI